MHFTYSKGQTIVLVILRMSIGWHFLYEGLYKLITPGWSSASFLKESQWILKSFAEWIVSHNQILQIVDFMNIWGLIAIGLGLILGLFTRPAAFSGFILLCLYYLINPPLAGTVSSMTAEGNYLIINKTFIEAVAMLIIFYFPKHIEFGLNNLIHRKV